MILTMPSSQSERTERAVEWRRKQQGVITQNRDMREMLREVGATNAHFDRLWQWGPKR